MNSFDRAFEDRLRDKLKDMRARKCEDIVRGMPMETYEREVGAVGAIDEVLALCDEIRKALLND